VTHDLPNSIRQINSLPLLEKQGIYKQLIPDWVFVDYRIDPETLLQDGQKVVRMRCPQGSRSLEISVRHDPHDLDPVMYLHMIDTFNFQLMVLLVIINDPESPRYNIDRDLEGHDTHFGTHDRNIPEELKAMQAGLAPGQVRQGLRSFRSTVPLFESFVERMGHELFMIEPLAYHNAVIFEKYGFSYTHGRQEMEWIHHEFQPGGILDTRLSEDNPFRQSDAGQTIRGRAWAIHDGILGHPFTGFRMYKQVGKHANVATYPNAKW